MESNRWWEFYFVRYFIGSVLGALVVMALAFHPESRLSSVIASLFDFSGSDVLKLKSDHFWVILSFGIAFCYLASAPILVMHALRANIDFQGGISTNIKVWAYRILVLSIALSLLYFWSGQDLTKLPFALVYAFIVALQLNLVIPAVFNRFRLVFDFYKRLTRNRAKDSADRKQYIESYKHLREHGNAFLILFCELVLGCALFFSSSLSEALLVVMIWLIPTIPIWFLGTSLESEVGNV